MLTGVTLARNEAKNLPRCLESLHFCDAILVIDDHSTDSTVKIAKKYGAKVITHSLNNDFSAQRNYALSQIKSGWTLFIDADEYVTPKLASEIIQKLKNLQHHAYLINREDVMWGRHLKHGDSHTQLIRLGRGGMGHWTGRVHETWNIDGRVGELKNLLFHYPHPTFYDFLKSINFYSTLRARELFDLRQKTNIFQIIFYPVFKFLHLGIWKLGFIDGTPGFISALAMSFHSFLVRGKLYLMSKHHAPDSPHN